MYPLILRKGIITTLGAVNGIGLNVRVVAVTDMEPNPVVVTKFEPVR